MKKILIFYTSVGLGHKSMAMNWAELLTGAGFEVKTEDILKIQGGKLADFGVAAHQFINRFLPWLWSWLYKSQFVNFITLPWRVPLASRNCTRAKQLILEFNPQIIISTQTTASAVVAYLKQKGIFTGKFGITFSDFHLHPFWLYKQADFYLANIQEQKDEMIKKGIKEENILVCGMLVPLLPEFNKQEIKAKLGINPEQKVALIASGSLGSGIDPKMVKDLSLHKDIFSIVVCGKNQKIYNQLQNLNLPENVRVESFYKPMIELYSIADIFISKPGGLSTTEALQQNLPLLVSHWLPGQEELNCDYLYKKQLVMPKPANLTEVALKELQFGDFKKQLFQNPAVKLVFPERTALLLEVINLLHRV